MADFYSHDNFQIILLLFFLLELMALTYTSPDWILIIFRRDLDLEFPRSSMEFATSK